MVQRDDAECGQWDPDEASHFKTVELHLTAIVLKKRFEF